MTIGVDVDALALEPEDVALEEPLETAVFDRETATNESFFPFDFEPVRGIGLSNSRAASRLINSSFNSRKCRGICLASHASRINWLDCVREKVYAKLMFCCERERLPTHTL